MVSPVEENTEIKIDEGRLLSLAQEMIAIKSITGQEHAMADWIAATFEKMGMDEIERIPVDGAGDTIVGVIDRSSDPEGPSMLLNFHLDTFPVCEGWETNPFDPFVKGNRLYGLGAHDMKGGAAALLGAVEALLDDEVGFDGRLVVAATSDEENWSRGAHALIQSGWIDGCEYCLIPEPSASGTLTIGARGRHVYRLVFHGKTVHSAYSGGINAVVDAARAVLELEKIENEMGYSYEFDMRGTQSIIGVKGGGTLVLVPETTEVFIDRFLLPGQTAEWAADQIVAAVERAGIEGTYELFWDERPTPAPLPYVVPPNSRFVETVTSILEQETGQMIRHTIARSVADTNHIAGHGGVPTMICGPTGGNTCEANEYVNIDSLLPTARVYARSVLALLGRT